ncbi:ABC transporter ATP-binding protein [Bacillus massiliigorillae]|uniref:ABC transporter ATP-binding protein n=1 Tax=Bacillus massiliigorillae TaxID=1243664 RepID=UPI0003A4FA57|nr:ABC transporter ATP-binding protein [Bacillus massiliigorillae]
MNIHVRNVTKKFQQHIAVNDVSFDIESGRCVALIGPNGAGKTTLLKMLVGLIKQDQGDISYHHDTNWRREIGFLPQIPSFYGWMTPKEFLLFMGKISEVDKSILKTRVDEVLLATGIAEASNRKIQGFSGGMKQRLGLAQALLHKPSFLLLDEPVSALDPVGRRDVMNILADLKKSTTIIYSTHVLHDAEEISDDVLLMKNGEIVAKGTMENLLSNAIQNYTLKTGHEIPKALSQCEFIKNISLIGKNTAEITLHPTSKKEELLQWCLDNNIDIITFQQGKQTLESVFLEVVKQ